MDPADLDQVLDRELRQLPRPRAPQTLLPRVLTATVDHEDRLPAATGWFTWPRAWQIASVAAFAALIVGVSLLITSAPTGVTSVTRTASDAATVGRVLWELLLQPVATYMFALGVSLALACAAVWAALEMALGGATHR
jgi:hypothetical protein